MRYSTIIPLLCILTVSSINAFSIQHRIVTNVFTPTSLYSTSSPLDTTSNSIDNQTTATTATNSNNNNKKWTPKIQSIEERRKLREKKYNSEIIGTKGFHHIEFYCGDAKSTAYRFALALGMSITCISGQSTGNDQCCSYGLESGDIRFLFTAPYSRTVQSQMSGDDDDDDDDNTADATVYDAPNPVPSFNVENAHEFFQKHGIAAKAVAVEVDSASRSFEAAVANGAKAMLPPTSISPCHGLSKVNTDASGCELAEVALYGDVVLRFVSFDSDSSHGSSSILPNYAPHQMNNNPNGETTYKQPNYGLQRIDHAVGNVPDLLETLQTISTFTGFHEFAEFTSEDVGTVDSGLNSVVLASDSEDVLLPINEPTTGKRKSQIQTYLEQNEGPGLQHLALKTNDIFFTIEKMRMAEIMLGGFELMARPSNEYYRELPTRLGDQLSPEQYQKIEELGILADADDEGILLQIFTKPIGDRPTFFIEIIQRIGCLFSSEGNEEDEASKTLKERPGCGGFGQGNYKELFKSIEDHEKTLKI